MDVAVCFTLPSLCSRRKIPRYRFYKRLVGLLSLSEWFREGKNILPRWKSTFDNPLLNITDMFRHKPFFFIHESNSPEYNLHNQALPSYKFNSAYAHFKLDVWEQPYINIKLKYGICIKKYTLQTRNMEPSHIYVLTIVRKIFFWAQPQYMCKFKNTETLYPSNTHQQQNIYHYFIMQTFVQLIQLDSSACSSFILIQHK
jgi:hypothetical protein